MYLLIKNHFKQNFQKGQTTLLMVLMVMVVSLGVGLAVSQRSTTNLRKTTNIKQTDQAYNAALTGVQKALACIRDAEVSNKDPSSECPKNGEGDSFTIINDAVSDSGQYKYTVSEYTASYKNKNALEFKKLIKDNVQQLNTSNTSSVTVEWHPLNASSSTGAGIEVTHAYKDGSDYKMKKYFYWCGNPPSNFTGFSVSNTCKETLNIGSYTESIIRIRPYAEDITLTVSSTDDGFKNLKQGYLIVSEGQAGGVTRTITQARMNPQLPAIFDYVLYSEEGSITK